MVFIASNLGVWLCLEADPRKLKREKVQNPTSAKITTLENFLLYGNNIIIDLSRYHYNCHILVTIFSSS